MEKKYLYLELAIKRYDKLLITWTEAQLTRPLLVLYIMISS